MVVVVVVMVVVVVVVVAAEVERGGTGTWPIGSGGGAGTMLICAGAGSTRASDTPAKHCFSLAPWGREGCGGGARDAGSCVSLLASRRGDIVGEMIFSNGDGEGGGRGCREAASPVCSVYGMRNALGR